MHLTSHALRSGVGFRGSVPPFQGSSSSGRSMIKQERLQQGRTEQILPHAHEYGGNIVPVNAPEPSPLAASAFPSAACKLQQVLTDSALEAERQSRDRHALDGSPGHGWVVPCSTPLCLMSRCMYGICSMSSLIPWAVDWCTGG